MLCRENLHRPDAEYSIFSRASLLSTTCSPSLLSAPALLLLRLSPLDQAGLFHPVKVRKFKQHAEKHAGTGFVKKKKKNIYIYIYIIYLIPFLPWNTWSLWKQRRVIVSLNGENPFKSKILSLLTLLPGSPRAPSLPWEQTGSTAHSPQLGNSLHHIMKQTVMKSRSC